MNKSKENQKKPEQILEENSQEDQKPTNKKRRLKFQKKDMYQIYYDF